MEEPAERPARGAVGQVQIDLPHACARAAASIVMPISMPKPCANGSTCASVCARQRPLSRDGRSQLKAAAPANRPVGKADRQARSRRRRAWRRPPPQDRPRLCAQPPQAGPAAPPTRPGLRRTARHGCLRRSPASCRSHRPRARRERDRTALADHPLAAHHRGACGFGSCARSVGRAVIGDPQRAPGNASASAASVAAMRSASL